jgi:hypothetical protein
MKIVRMAAVISLLVVPLVLPVEMYGAATATPVAPPPANPSQISPPRNPQPNQSGQPIVPLDIQRMRNQQVPTRGTTNKFPTSPTEPGTNQVPGRTNAVGMTNSAGMTNWPSFPTNYPPARTNLATGTNGVPGMTNWPLWPTNWPLMATNPPAASANGTLITSTNTPFGATNAGAGPTATNRYVQTNTLKFLTNSTTFPR